MRKYWSRITSSARGELFNPLIWPFLVCTFAYGIGFTFFGWTHAVGASSAYQALSAVGSLFPLAWGIVAILTIVLGFTFLMFNLPPAGKISGLIGFMLWLMIGIAYAIEGAYLVLISVAGVNMFFWAWQYISLSRFRREDAEDQADSPWERIVRAENTVYDNKQKMQQRMDDNK